MFFFGSSVGNYTAHDKRCTEQDDTSLFVHGWRWLRAKVSARRREGYDVL